jgi:predicted transcriptional regulator
MALTQQQIADHLDLSQAEVSKFLKQMEIEWKESSLDDVRVAYLRKLRGQAAGHRSDGGLDLVHERVLTERIDRELKQFTLAEKKGQLINVEQLEPELMQMAGAFRTELLARDDKLKDDLDLLYGIAIDIQVINAYTLEALRHLARYSAGGEIDGDAIGTLAGAAGTDIAVDLVADA